MSKKITQMQIIYDDGTIDIHVPDMLGNFLYNGITPENRPGAPRFHWLEIALATADTRINTLLLNQHLPKVGLISHPYFAPVDRQTLESKVGKSVYDRIDTATIYRLVDEFAHRNVWHSISHSKKLS